MPRKKQESKTTNIRYRLKAYRQGLGTINTPENSQLALEFANAASEVRIANNSPYHKMWLGLKPFLRDQKIGVVYWAVLKGLASELMKNQDRNLPISNDVLLGKYTAMGVPSNYCSAVMDFISKNFIMASTSTTSTEKS